MITETTLIELDRGVRTSRRDTSDRFANRSFQQRDLATEDDPVKEQQRDKVLDRLLSEFDGDAVRYLGLPGARWTFERKLESTVGESNCQFRGIESSWRVAQFGAGWMPGGKALYFTHPLWEGEVNGFENDRATIVNAWAGSWMSLTRRDVWCPDIVSERTQKRRVEKFHRKFSDNNMIWLDFTSNLCGEVIQALEGLFRRSSVKCQRVPICITLMMGREDGIRGGLAGREAIMKATLDRNRFLEFKPLDSWTYRSDCNANMATWFGVYQRRVSTAVKYR